MPLYFAYGANMDLAGMAERCPLSRPLGRARLARHRLLIMAGGFASVAPDPRASVHGVLWDLALRDVRALDQFEDVSRGLYKKVQLPVLREPSGSARALVYVGRWTQPGAPAPEYLAGVIAAARHWALPAGYVAFLESLGRGASEESAAPSMKET
jgi:gamma-glutamylcyclotransferase (GGCT)/AIG2-like uncharacterized protein YtfP